MAESSFCKTFHCRVIQKLILFSFVVADYRHKVYTASCELLSSHAIIMFFIFIILVNISVKLLWFASRFCIISIRNKNVYHPVFFYIPKFLSSHNY